MAEEVKFFAAPGSPFSCRAQIALNLKGIQYEYIRENISNKSHLLLQYNPLHKKIPVLLHNGKPIVESLVIVEYIDETWKGNPILPQDPYERSMARFWAKFLDDKCIPALWKACWSKGEEQEKAIEEATGFLKTLENELKDNKFFGGDSIGLVDIAAVFIGFWLELIQEVTGLELLTKEKFPRLSKWIEEFLSCSIIKETLPPTDYVLGIFRARYTKASA